MSQPDYNFTYILTGTSTGNVAIKTGPTLLHAVTINTVSTSATNTLTLYNATSSATGQVASVTLSTLQTLLYDIVLPAGLFVGSTTSTGDATVSWA